MGQSQLLEIEGNRYTVKFYVMDSRPEREPYEDCKRDPKPRELYWNYHTETLVIDKRTGARRFLYLDSTGEHWKWNFEHATFNAGESVTGRLKIDRVGAFVDCLGAALLHKVADIPEFPLPSLVLRIGRSSRSPRQLDIDIDALESEGILAA